MGTCASCRLASLPRLPECRPATSPGASAPSSVAVRREPSSCAAGKVGGDVAAQQRLARSLAAQHGFANAYHFSRRFSQAYRMPPGTFRALGLGPDPLEPVLGAGLLPFAAPLMSTAPS